MSRFFALFVFLCSQVTLYAGADSVSVKELSLENIHYIDKGVYRSEQPDKLIFKELEKFGIKEVLNLRYWHNNDEEIGNSSIVSHRVKMNAHNITDKAVIKALRVIKNRKGDILFHCRHGSDRTGTIAAMYRIIFQGWSKDKALDELKNGNYGYHKIFINIPKYINKADVDYIKREVFKD